MKRKLTYITLLVIIVSNQFIKTVSACLPAVGYSGQGDPCSKSVFIGFDAFKDTNSKFLLSSSTLGYFIVSYISYKLYRRFKHKRVAKVILIITQIIFTALYFYFLKEAFVKTVSGYSI